MPVPTLPTVRREGERDRALGGDDALLTRRAIDGDRAAFAELYRRHERRAYNLCLRLLGSQHDAADATQEAFLNVFRRLPELGDRPLRFDAYVLTAARHASYDLLERRGRQRPTEEIVATADDAARPGDGRRSPHEDPERRVLLEAQQEQIRRANACLPERQREVLALRELGELSYDEIAEIMGLNRNAVAQLISRARINLRAALRRTALDSVAAAGPDCERALALIAAHADGETGAGDDWLDAHLDDCESCPVAREAMAEAGASYRAWVPLAAAPWLFRDTMAKAAEIAGEDWGEILEQAAPEASAEGEGPQEDQPGNASGGAPTPGARAWGSRRRAAGAGAVLLALVMLGALAPTLGDATRPAALIVPQISLSPPPAASERRSSQPGKRRAKAPLTGGAEAPSALAGATPPPGRAAAPAADPPASSTNRRTDPLEDDSAAGTIVAGDPPPPPPPPPPLEPPPPPPPGDTGDPGTVRPPPPPPPPPPGIPPVLTGTPPPPPCSTAVCPPRP